MTQARRSSRHRSREVALQTLFAVDLASSGRSIVQDVDAGPPSDPLAVPPFEPAEALEAVAAHFEMPPGAKAFALELVAEVCAHREKLDERIAAHARNWRVERMPAVDRNVLRLAVHELVHTETPVAVVLNEAVELAHRFGADSSPSFVNGVLAAVAREVRGTEVEGVQ